VKEFFYHCFLSIF